jgi:hypothetical protein
MFAAYLRAMSGIGWLGSRGARGVRGVALRFRAGFCGVFVRLLGVILGRFVVIEACCCSVMLPACFTSLMRCRARRQGMVVAFGKGVGALNIGRIERRLFWARCWLESELRP